jgi:hypothetical protein
MRAMRMRAMPRVGQRVLVVFLATRQAGVVGHVDADLHGLEVDLLDGERLRFVLNPGTGRFVVPGDTSVRLYFGEAE